MLDVNAINRQARRKSPLGKREHNSAVVAELAAQHRAKQLASARTRTGKLQELLQSMRPRDRRAAELHKQMSAQITALVDELNAALGK
jgi:hypothetical protein